VLENVNQDKAEVHHKENVDMEIDILGSSIPDENASQSEAVCDPSQSKPQISKRIPGSPVYVEVLITVEEEKALPDPPRMPSNFFKR
jgi:hypothetical protein